jgi:hypothetical protein
MRLQYNYYVVVIQLFMKIDDGSLTIHCTPTMVILTYAYRIVRLLSSSHYNSLNKKVRVLHLPVWQAVEDAYSLHSVHFRWISRGTSSVPCISPSLILGSTPKLLLNCHRSRFVARLYVAIEVILHFRRPVSVVFMKPSPYPTIYLFP